MTSNSPKLAEETIDVEVEAAIIDEILNHNSALMDLDPDMRRAQHPKHHGLAQAVFRVKDGIPDNLARGIFSNCGEFKALIRFSNGQQKDDRKPDAHGMAIKLLDVPGEPGDWFLPDPVHPSSFDFLLVDHPVMFAKTLAQYRAASEFIHDVEEIKAGCGGWFRDKIEGALQAAEAGELVLEGGLRLLLRMKRFASHEMRSPLDARYWSQTPYLLGAGQAVKYMVRPEDGGTGASVPKEGEDMLAAALAKGLEGGPVRFVFGVHVQDDPVEDPIEDATVPWWAEEIDPGGAGSMNELAEIEIEGLQPDGAEGIAFSPWNVTADHKPLGGINRVRGKVYGDLAKRRRP
ncbi:hypothetical protein [uncultured Roseobacter sp.]|uniref:hypothetical protein n=1 Tax=uncultured Roseobacter sp. TaxID=114847 RepID=UPI0026130DE5|nr:hypothetical protein [uncultured Roseobacter sp.]